MLFKKKERVGHVYKEVTDWNAVLGAAFCIFIGLALLSSCAG